jgi:hypothetical protein
MCNLGEGEDSQSIPPRPSKGQEGECAHYPTCHCQLADDRRPFHVLRTDGYTTRSTAAGLADEASVVIEVGEDFEEDFYRELENYPVQVRWGIKTTEKEIRVLTPAILGLLYVCPYLLGDRCRSPLFGRHRNRGWREKVGGNISDEGLARVK